MISIDDALLIAAKAHRGQLDLDGNPEILHPLAVGLAGSNQLETVVGFLHDVVEDSDFSFVDLKENGVGKEELDALRLLTHDDNLSYDEYIERIATSGNITALHVKLNDLHNNLWRGRRGGHTRIVEKHEKALKRLGGIEAK